MYFFLNVLIKKKMASIFNNGSVPYILIYIPNIK